MDGCSRRIWELERLCRSWLGRWIYAWSWSWISWPSSSSLHNDYLLAPKRLITDRVEKLIPNFHFKEKCVLYSRNLKNYTHFGMKFKMIHREFKLKPYARLKPYIYLNTKLRTGAKSDFEKDFYRLMKGISVFGKTMENIRNKVVMRFIRQNRQSVTSIFDENLMAVHMQVTHLVSKTSRILSGQKKFNFVRWTV